MINRKDFLKTGLMGLLPIGWLGTRQKTVHRGPKPVVISTWRTTQKAVDEAWSVLDKGGYALDALEAGVKLEEADPDNMTVGYGGRPDREGRVTLDACVMNEKGNCGSVAFMQNIKHPVSVARKVMTDSPHVMIVGEGATQFAEDMGFEKQDLLTPKAEKAWKKWLKSEEYKPIMNIENHDTIGMLALDREGRVCGACSTSGMAWKMHGRVGDSPIIGAGLFIDPETGGAAATGHGEEVLKVAGCHLVVEMMRQGYAPEEACKIAAQRILDRDTSNRKDVQVGFIALNKEGAFGGFSLQKGFSYIVANPEMNKSHKSRFLIT